MYICIGRILNFTSVLIRTGAFNSITSINVLIQPLSKTFMIRASLVQGFRALIGKQRNHTGDRLRHGCVMGKLGDTMK